MGVLNTFTLLFRTDAVQAKNEIAALDKQIEALKAKGKKQSEDESKQLKEAVDRRKELTQGLKDEANAGDGLADSLSRATAALVGFAAIRAQISNSNNFNSALQVQSDLTMQATTSLGAYAQAAKTMGGSREGFLSDAQRFATDALARGADPSKYFEGLQKTEALLKTFKGPNAEKNKRNYLNNTGYTNDPGTQEMLLNGTLEKNVAEAQKSLGKTDQDYENAYQATQHLSKIEANTDNMATTLSSLLGPSASGALQGAGGTLLQAAGVLSIGRSVVKKLFGRGAPPIAEGATEGAAAEAVAGTGLVAGGLIAGGAIAAGGTIYYHKQIADWFTSGADKAQRKRFQDQMAGVSEVSGGSDRTSTALKYFMSKGYTPAQAAGMVANLKQESALNPNSRGDSGQAVGIAQWHPDRVKAILKATGIDVRTASFEKQLDAVAYEMQNGNIGFDDKLFRSITNAGAAGQYASTNFERPRDKLGEAMRRGQAAMGLMAGGDTGGGGKSVSVKIDRIDVNTQATDAQGISQAIGQHLSTALGALAGNFDDGVQA